MRNTVRKFSTAGALLIAFVSCGTPSGPNAAVTAAAPVIYNLDSSEFFVGTFGPVEAATIDSFAAEHARAGVTDLLINVNAQRVNYNSDVWEPAWSEKNPDAPKVEWITNTGVLHEAGVDYPERMLAQAKQNGMRGWISIRMNDAHLPNEPEHPLHSDFWREHSDWHLANTGLDFARPEVRRHYIDLIREVTERYDLDGVELDFLRFRYYFREGEEEAGLPLMTALVQTADSLVAVAARRLGHPVDLAVRVPTSPHVSKALGLDVATWVDAGWIDLLVASPFWSSTNTDIRLDEWKELIGGRDIVLAVSSEDGIDSGGVQRRTMTRSEMRGLFAQVVHDGARPYFFNLFTNPWQLWSHADYLGIIEDVADESALYGQERQHAVTIEDPWVEGEPRPRELLPVTGMDHSFRINIGPAPDASRPSFVELVVDGDATVSVNGHAAQDVRSIEPTELIAIGIEETRRPPRRSYAIATDALQDGYNTVRIQSDEPVTVRWVEIRVQ